MMNGQHVMAGMARRILARLARRCLLSAAVIVSATGQWAAAAGDEPVRATVVARGLESPWSLAFLPDGRMLVTERPGRMRVLTASGSVSVPVSGLPEVHARGQGGLFDVVLGPDFAHNRLIYFSFAQPTEHGARTAVARAELDLAALEVRNVKVIFAQNEDPPGAHHWGARLVFAADGTLFVTLGDRFGFRDRAQDLGSHLGKIVRIRTDGSVPPDNPFVGKAGALPEIWSYGHRNVQGAALHPVTGRLWISEHGPQGGDEVNEIFPGRNYGWPVITHGREYVVGTPIGEGTTRADVEPSRLQWTPSIAPSGLSFYTGERYPGWTGGLFAGSLKFRMLVRMTESGGQVHELSRLLRDEGRRIRDVRQGPDGKLWLLEETDGSVLRLDPV